MVEKLILMLKDKEKRRQIVGIEGSGADAEIGEDKLENEINRVMCLLAKREIKQKKRMIKHIEVVAY